MSNLTQGASRGALWHGVAQIALTASGYIVAVILARSLGPVDFGLYGVIYSFLMATELIVHLGIPGALVRLLAERESDERALSATGVTLAAACYLTAFVVLWFAAPWLAAALNVPAETELFRVAILDLPFFGLYYTISHVLNGKRNFVTPSVANILYALTKVAGMGVLGVVGITIAGALIVNVLASVVGLIVVAYASDRAIFVPMFARTAPILRLAGPVALIGLGTQLLLYVDLWSIGVFVGHTAEEGYYVAAKNLARIPNLVSFVLMAVLVPSIGRARATGDAEVVLRLTEGTMRFLAVTLLPGCVLMAVEAQPLMELMFSAQYKPGAPYLVLLVLANGLFHTVLTTCIAILLATGQQRRGAFLVMAAVVPGVILSGSLAPKLGAIGSAYAALLSSAIAAIAAAYYIRREVGGLIVPWVAIKALVATAVVGSIAYMLRTSGLWTLVEMVFLMCVFWALSFAWRTVTPEDLRQLQQGPRGSNGGSGSR